MKPKQVSIIAIIFIALVIALVIANFNHPVAAQNLSAVSISQQVTPTPAVDSTSVIGSTDGIMLMGIIISLIVIIPVLFRRKNN